jgi:hypothetical protein
MIHGRKAQSKCMEEKNKWIRSLIRTVAWLLAEFREPEAVESVWIWVDLWVEVDSN